MVTRNERKLNHAKRILSKYGIIIEQVSIELQEIQGDLREIVLFKLREAWRVLRKPLVVEDSGLFIEALGGFPGPYTSYVLSTIGHEGLLKLLRGCNNRRAFFRSVVGYKDDRREVLFEGRMNGSIIDRENARSLDDIFLVREARKPLSQLSDLERERFLDWSKSFEALGRWLALANEEEIQGNTR